MIALYENSKANNEFLYKLLSGSLCGISRRDSSEFVKISTLLNSEIITEKLEISFSGKCETSTLPQLSNFFDVSQGVVEAPDRISKKTVQNFPQDSLVKGAGVFVLSKDEVDSLGLTSVEQAALVKYLDGGDVSRYNISYTNKFLIYSDKILKDSIAKNGQYSHIKKHLDRYSKYISSSNGPYGIHRPRSRDYFELAKIVTPSMFKVNQFALDIGGHYVGMSFSVITKTGNISLEYLIAILNSKFALKWFYDNGKHRGVGVDIGVDKLRSFPITEATTETVNKISELVMRILQGKSIGSSTSELEALIDEIVYEIYGISKDEQHCIEEFCEKLK